jgi:hypothetical protein
MGAQNESVGVHSFALSYTPMSMKCDFQVSLLARTFVNPCLGHEPKVRVATIICIENIVINNHFTLQPGIMGKEIRWYIPTNKTKNL